MTNARTYGEQLRYWMEKRKVRQATLAQMSGITRAAVSKLVNGRSQANSNTHSAICRSLSIPEDRFFSLEL